MRIDKLISNSTSLSRKEIKSYIKKGLIVCNGEPVKNAELKVDEMTAEIYVCGEKVVYAEFLNNSKDLHFNQCAFWQSRYSNTAAGWFACEVFCINSVELGKAIDVGKKTGRFYNIFKSCF